jgi:GNAT superfamily N-acetyltransferase
MTKAPELEANSGSFPFEVLSRRRCWRWPDALRAYEENFVVRLKYTSSSEYVSLRIAEEHEHTDEVEEAVRRGIRTADPRDVGARDYETLHLSMRDADGTIQAGIYGATMWKWLMIDGLWVAAAQRGQGIGSAILLAAEDEAMKRGCVGAWLGTFDFQARSFYERHGYRVFAELAGFPSGHTHFHLFKRFTAASPSAAISAASATRAL